MQTSRADAIATTLGLQRVGIIFNQSTSEKDYILNDQEVQQICQLQASVGEHCVAAVFSFLEEDGHVRCSGQIRRINMLVKYIASVPLTVLKCVPDLASACAERGSLGSVSMLRPGC